MGKNTASHPKTNFEGVEAALEGVISQKQSASEEHHRPFMGKWLVLLLLIGGIGFWTWLQSSPHHQNHLISIDAGPSSVIKSEQLPAGLEEANPDERSFNWSIADFEQLRIDVLNPQKATTLESVLEAHGQPHRLEWSSDDKVISLYYTDERSPSASPTGGASLYMDFMKAGQGYYLMHKFLVNLPLPKDIVVEPNPEGVLFTEGLVEELPQGLSSRSASTNLANVLATYQPPTSLSMSIGYDNEREIMVDYEKADPSYLRVVLHFRQVSTGDWLLREKRTEWR